MSMVGVLTAAGLAGGLAMIVAQVTKQQMQTQKKSETGVEVVAMSQRIVRTLYDGDACLNTIGAGTAISAGGSITVNAIKNKKGEDVYKSLDNDPNAPAYGNRLLKVKSLKVKVASSPSPITGTQAEAKLEVVMRRESSAYTGQKTVTKKFPLTLNLDASKKLTGCLSNMDVMTAGICNSLGGNWQGGTCELPNPVVNKECSTGKVQIGFDGTGEPKCVSLDCPAGQVLKGINASTGAVTCAALPSGGASVTGKRCGQTNHVMKGIASNGDPECVPDQTGGGSGTGAPANILNNKKCANDQIFKGFDSGGNAICKAGCPSGEVLRGFKSSDGSADCVSSSSKGWFNDFSPFSHKEPYCWLAKDSNGNRAKWRIATVETMSRRRRILWYSPTPYSGYLIDVIRKGKMKKYKQGSPGWVSPNNTFHCPPHAPHRHTRYTYAGDVSLHTKQYLEISEVCCGQLPP